MKMESMNCPIPLCLGGSYLRAMPMLSLFPLAPLVEVTDVEPVDEILVVGIVTDHRGDGGGVEEQHERAADQDRRLDAAVLDHGDGGEGHVDDDRPQDDHEAPRPHSVAGEHAVDSGAQRALTSGGGNAGFYCHEPMSFPSPWRIRFGPDLIRSGK